MDYAATMGWVILNTNALFFHSVSTYGGPPEKKSRVMWEKLRLSCLRHLGMKPRSAPPALRLWTSSVTSFSLSQMLVKILPTMHETWVWIFLPGEFLGKMSLVSYSPWGRKKSGAAEQLTLSLFTFPDVKWAQCLFIVRFTDPCQDPNGTWNILATQ